MIYDQFLEQCEKLFDQKFHLENDSEFQQVRSHLGRVLPTNGENPYVEFVGDGE